MTFVLLPSALLGAAALDPLATVLRAGGASVVVAETGAAATGGAVLAAYVAAAHRLADPVLVAHSNAGYFAPTVLADTSARAIVYVDAALPHAGGPTPLAPPTLREHLAGLADADGMLPPWTQWWHDTTGLFPDDATRALIEERQPRLPLRYLDGVVQAPPGWQDRPQGYLAFGSTYAEELERATSHGWPTRQLDGGHLHLLHDPVLVATAVLDLCRELR